MYLEERLNNEKMYLVNEMSYKHKGACCWIDCSQDGFKEYGNGNKLFYFFYLHLFFYIDTPFLFFIMKLCVSYIFL